MKRITINTITTTLAAAFLASGAWAQSTQVPAPRQSEPVIIHSATIHTLTGDPIENGHIVIVDGVITAIGPGMPRGVTGNEINAEGLHVYPGLISSQTDLGLTEIGAVDVTRDARETGNIKPEVRAAVAVNPDTELIPVARANGILTAMTFPSGGTIAGRCSLMRMDGWTWEQMAVDPEAGLVISWPRIGSSGRAFRGGRGRGGAAGRAQGRAEQQIQEIDDWFEKTRLYYKAREANPDVELDLRYEAMRPYINGEKPIFVLASSSGQIGSAVTWAERQGVKIVIVGGTEADEVAPLLVRHDVPVILTGVHRTPSTRHGAYDEAFTLPARLHEMGVRFCLTAGGGASSERNLNHQAGTAAAFGLPEDVALKSISTYAAEILGVGDQLGTLEIGKLGSVIITTGTPLEITTDVLVGFIEGRQVDLGSKHKDNYAKYLEKYRQLGMLDDSTAQPNRRVTDG